MIKLPLNVDYKGKVVVVTGAGGVICGSMARAFAQSGAKVAALDLNEDAVKKLAQELRAEGFICEGYKANVLDAEALEEVHKAVLKELGEYDEEKITDALKKVISAKRADMLETNLKAMRIGAEN